MSEVKVKITAQNETQSGFQSALNTAKRFSSEARAASSSMSSSMGKGSSFSAESFYSQWEAKAEQQINANLARSAAARAQAAAAQQTFTQTTDSGIMGTIGRFALLATAAAIVGKVISGGIDRVSEAFQRSAEISKGFAESLRGAGKAGTMQGAINEFEQLNKSADQTKKTLADLQGKTLGQALGNFVQGSPGQIFSRGADLVARIGGGQGTSGFMAEQEANQRAAARAMLVSSLERQRLEAEAIAGAGGDPEKIAKAKTIFDRGQMLSDIKSSLAQGGMSQVQIDQQVAQLAQTFALLDKSTLAQRAFSEGRTGTRVGNNVGEQLGPGNFAGKSELDRQRQAAKAALGQELSPGTADAAAGGFRVDQALFQQQQAEAAAKQIMERQNSFQGSSGASSLQRIGFASSEFFDTRAGKKDPAEETKRAADLVKEILAIIKKGEPLVLPAS